MEIALNHTVGEVVKINYKTASLFQANHIDYCCGGKKTISDACEEAGIEPGEFIRQLRDMSRSQDPDSAYINELKPDVLADYIVNRHHSYVRKMIPFITATLEKVSVKHGMHHPELFKIQDMFRIAAGNLSMHMQKEELMLFPYIRKMVRASESEGTLPESIFGSVSNPIRSMIGEHTDEGNRFDEIARLSEGYTAPADACTSYRILYENLREFEEDLHRHIHLENNILFPDAERLEADLRPR